MINNKIENKKYVRTIYGYLIEIDALDAIHLDVTDIVL